MSRGGVVERLRPGGDAEPVPLMSKTFCRSLAKFGIFGTINGSLNIIAEFQLYALISAAESKKRRG